MCKKCENECYIKYEPNTDAYIMKTILEGGYIWTQIKYCPWCGRKL